MIFGILWLTAFLEHCNIHILLVSVAQYYFSSDASGDGSADVCTAAKYSVTCHSGSMALGSFIIAVIRFIRLCLLYAAKQMEKTGGDNQVAKAVVACA